MKTVITLYIDAEILRKTKELTEERKISKKVEELLANWLDVQGFADETEKARLLLKKQEAEKKHREASDEIATINDRLSTITEIEKVSKEKEEQERLKREEQAKTCLRCKQIAVNKFYKTASGIICHACFVSLGPGEGKKYGL